MTTPESPDAEPVFDVELMRDVVEIMAELRTIVMEADDDTPVDESLLALAIERARARTSK